MTFPPTSRYYLIETTTIEIEPERPLRYLRRRFLPPLDRFVPVQEHLVKQGHRLDNIAARYLGDPEQFWRICDANPILAPEELEVVGRRVLITLPEGMPGASGV